jgi:cell division protein FtsQ
MLIAVCAVLALVALGLAASWPGFDPKSVAVTGNERVARTEILDRAAVASDQSMWFQSLGAMRARIETIPYIASASVRRLPPASIVIVVSERTPFAVVRSGDDAAVVDRGLRVLQAATGEESLPVFSVKPGVMLTPGEFLTQDGIITLRDDYEAMIAAHVSARELELDRFGGLVATVRGGIRVLLGDENDFGKKLALVDPILSQVVSNQRQVAAIDLRAPAAPVIVYR